MSKAKKNAERERRIEMEIIVDANGPEELLGAEQET